jgi:glutathione S-transferase
MPIVLYDLAGGDGRRFSPYCWRVRLALAHKGLEVETRPVCFTEIAAIGPGQTTVPVIEADGRQMRESFDIALHLEETYPDRPSLFGGEGGVALSRFVEAWANGVLNPGLMPFVVADIHAIVADKDRGYFRESREKRFGGRTLEALQAGREERLDGFRKTLEPLRAVLRRQPFLGGAAPLYADYIVAGSLQWARVVSAFRILADDDLVADWFGRVLDLHGGLGRSQRAA